MKRHWHLHVRRRDRAPGNTDHYRVDSFDVVCSILLDRYEENGVIGTQIESAEFHWVYSCNGETCARWEHVLDILTLDTASGD